MTEWKLDSLGSFFNPFLSYLQNGFETVNAWQGILVALATVVFMKRWRQLVLATLAASIAYILVEHFWAIGARGAPMRLPNVTVGAFWQRFGAVYVGLLIIVAMFFAGKATLMRMRGSRALEAPPAPKKA